jgi:hypothetical protein
MTVIYEYRINKKGAECFRSRDLEQTKDRLRTLSGRRPGVYTMQARSIRLDRYGRPYDRDWTPWR